ncbi:MAG: hypothetical protein IJP62_04925 [Treponema sp.]|nr:hypothetical protein [Treponema sp.]
MKRILKSIAFIFAACVCGAVFAEESIELPDVTTVVSGGAITAGKDSVPDYSPVLPSAEDGRVSLPQVADNSGGIVAPAAPEPTESKGTRFRIGGGIYTGFPLGDDFIRQKIEPFFVVELPFAKFQNNMEIGGAAHILTGGAIAKSAYEGGFAGGIAAELYLRIPLHTVFSLQPSFGYELAVNCANRETFVDSEFLLACSARFIPQSIRNGAFECALTPVLEIAPASENAVCTLGVRLGVLFGF